MKIVSIINILLILTPNILFSQMYDVRAGTDSQPARVYNSTSNTTTFYYTVSGNGEGSMVNRLKAFMVQIPNCPGGPLSVVGFSPDLQDGDQPPFPSTNPSFYDQDDEYFGFPGIKWHGWHGGESPAVLLEPDASRVFSFTLAGNIPAGPVRAGFWHWRGMHFVTPVEPIAGPACDVHPTPTPTPSHTPTPTPTPSHTPTPTPSHTPTPTPACPAYTTIKKVQGRIPSLVYRWQLWSSLTEDGLNLQCLQDLDQEAMCDSQSYASKSVCDNLSPLWVKLYIDACDAQPKSFECKQFKSTGRFGAAKTLHPRWQQLFFDSNCDLLWSPTEKQEKYACPAETVTVRMSGKSPISFIWEQGFDIEDVKVKASFPLDPNIGSEEVEWKASAKTPLLVFDPERTGKVSSAFQLFGDYALGGDRQVKVASDAASDYSVHPWEHGYAALGSLDMDGNRELTGAELSNLSLWFDKDQDAISDPGEVIPLTDLNVTKVFYDSPRYEAKTDSHVLDAGFERVVNGETMVGRSIDWRSQK